MAQETAKLEAEAFELEQRTALAAEAKSVLDSWVRYEGQVKQRQQRELAQSVISKITKELENPRTLQQILNQSVADVESKCFVDNVLPLLITVYRNRVVQSAIEILVHICKHALSSDPAISNLIEAVTNISESYGHEQLSIPSQAERSHSYGRDCIHSVFML